MLTADTKLISVDDHVIEPPHTWVDRVPAKYRDAAPRIVQREDGRQVWVYEEQVVPIMPGTVRFRPEVTVRHREAANFDEMLPGCYEPIARLKAMDTDGVWAELCFPNFARFAGHRFFPTTDPELSAVCIRAYNDFIFDEWCAADPDRLLALMLIPWWDIDASVAEIDRLADRGPHGIAFTENPTVLGMPSVHTEHYDPIWARAEALDVAICMHIGSSSQLVTSSDDAHPGVQWTATGINSMLAMADWLFSGVLDRFPGLRVLYSEGGAGWVPYILERAQKLVDISNANGRALGIKRTPHEYFRDNMFACMVTDEFAIASREAIGIDNLMWEADFPHSDGMYPRSRTNLERVLADVPDEDARKICELNARRAFRLPASTDEPTRGSMTGVGR
jgi:predicted TIM-barrel fold metal-dependent hydrolase